MNRGAITALIVAAALIIASVMIIADSDDKQSIKGEWCIQSYEGYDTEGVYSSKNIVDDPEIERFNLVVLKEKNGLVNISYSGEQHVGTFSNGVLLVKGTITNDDAERIIVIIGTLVNNDVMVFAEMGMAVDDTSSQSIYMQIYTRNNATFEPEYPAIQKDWLKSAGYSLGVSSDTPDALIGDKITVKEQTGATFFADMEQAYKDDDDVMKPIDRTLRGVVFPTAVKGVVNTNGYAFDEWGTLWYISFSGNKMLLRGLQDAEINPESNYVNSIYRIYTCDGSTAEEPKAPIDLAGTKWKVESMETIYSDGKVIQRVQDYTLEIVNQYELLATGYWYIDDEKGGNAFSLTVDENGKVYINIYSDYSDALDMGYGWFSDDGKLHITEIYVESGSTQGDNGKMAADNTVFVKL